MIEILVETSNMNLPMEMKDNVIKDHILAFDDVSLNHQFASPTTSRTTVEETKEPETPPSCSKSIVWNFKHEHNKACTDPDSISATTNLCSAASFHTESNIPAFTPPPLPPPQPWAASTLKPLALRRSKSDPGFTDTSRRVLFAPFWKARGMDSSAPNCASLHPNNAAPSRKRAVSFSGPCHSSSSTSSLSSSFYGPALDTPSDILLREFPAPWHQSALLADHEFFVPLDQMRNDQDWPELPHPIKRYYNKGTRCCLGGAYPLNVDPKSILKSSSYTNSSSLSLCNNTSLPSSRFNLPSHALNLTRSLHNFEQLKSTNTDKLIKSDSGDSASTSSASSSLQPHRVTFDPRITVTEFDDKYPRRWFSERDLERFRMDTILVAQKYFVQHPEMVALYNQSTLDPLTGTMRKKALFSLPVLSAEMDESEINELDGNMGFLSTKKNNIPTFASPGYLMQEISNEHVKKILIVDRNALVLDLMQRSIQPIFPTAEIVVVKSADEAWHAFQAALRRPGMGFDIVIAEQRLHQPLTSSGTPLIKSGKSYNELKHLVRSPLSPDHGVPRPSLARHDSLPSSQISRNKISTANSAQNLTGAELLGKLKAFEEVSLNAAARRDLSSLAPPTRSRRALLIGLSVHPDQDREFFLQKGVDFVWGKPPPKMDVCLRDELAMKLVRKRRIFEQEAQMMSSTISLSHSSRYDEVDEEEDDDASANDAAFDS